MQMSPVRGSRLSTLLLTLFGFSLVLLGLAVWFPAESAAQKAAQKKEEEEEKPKEKSPAKSPKKEEDEDTGADLDEATPVDLAAEAKNAPAGPIRALLQSLATPHDDLTTPSGRVDHVVPLNRYLGSSPDFSGKLTLTRIEANGKLKKLQPISKREVASVTSYEEIALRDVSAFFEKKEQPRLDALVAAEKALIFALRFHARERQGKAEHASQWKKIEEGLRLKWVEVRHERVSALADAQRWDEAFRLADQLARDKKNIKLLKSQLEIYLDLPRIALRKAEKTGKLEDYVSTRYRLEAFEKQQPSSPEAEAIRRGLKARASDLRDEGRALAKTDTAAAIDKLREATKVWPDLDGLREELSALDSQHPVVYVGVSRLPRYFSPALAWTDPEKQAVELLFDSLLKRIPERGGLSFYRPSLALAPPRVIHLGRELFLDEQAKWSDGSRLTAADIAHTVSLLKKPDLPGRNTAWARLVDKFSVATAGPNQLRITLSNGFLDPLSLMTFKILPRQWGEGKPLKKADDPAFADNPLGSGPFVLEKGKRDTAVVFTASPYYKERAGRSNRLKLEKIQFAVSANPVKDLLAKESHLHLLLDLPTARVKDLLDGGFSGQNVVTKRPPRVYFLAVNHTNDYLQNTDLRKAIGHAIDREAILAGFRAGFVAVDSHMNLKKEMGAEDEKLHPALNGPYPVGSWAVNPTVPASLYNLDLAKNKARDALKKLGEVSLKLRYPDDDPRAAEACRAICAQVNKLDAKIRVEPFGLPPHDFRDALLERKYELAYCHYDYTSDVYWLAPLFDSSGEARAPGGSNFLRYENDEQLDSLLGQAMNSRDFNAIKKVTHEIHAHIVDKMPIIPLWQLHTHIAVHPQLKTGELDPLLVFTNVEDWKLQK
jgi:ABC-type transport system substrate-binding protein